MPRDSADTLAEIVRAHNAAEAHTRIAARLGVSRQYVGYVVQHKNLRPRRDILRAQRAVAVTELQKAKQAARERRAIRQQPHLTPMAERLATLWKDNSISVTDIARELSTTPECVMKTASVYRRHFPDLFPRREGGAHKGHK
jgi:hypothetical protein